MANPTVQIAIVYTPGSGLAIQNIGRDLRAVSNEVDAANRRLAASVQSSQARLNSLSLTSGVIARAQFENQQRFVQLIENSRRRFSDLVVLQGQSLRLSQQQLALVSRGYSPLPYSTYASPPPPRPPPLSLGYNAPYARSGTQIPSYGTTGAAYMPYGGNPMYGSAGMYNTYASAPLQLGPRGINWGAPPPSMVGGGIASLGGGPPRGPGMFAGLSGQPGPFNFNWGDFLKGAKLGQNSLNALTGTISNLQMITARLAFAGFRFLIAEIVGVTSVVYKLSRSFLEINEKFAVFQIMLSSILKSATQAGAIRSEITRITATSPIPFEGLAELVKSLAIIPGTRQGLIQQAQSGRIQDPEGFLQRSVKMVEQMLTFRPDKRVEDAIFSIREALSGEFRSLVRRFDIPISAIAAYSGVPVQQLKKDPQKALQAMQELFNQLVNPEAVREAARQPSKLFQNILEQIFTNPILALGSDSKIQKTGKSLYDSILQPFQVLLGQATQFSQNIKIGGVEQPGTSPLAQFSQKAAQPIYEMFTKAMVFLADSFEQVLAKYGLKSTPGTTLMERVSNAITTGLEELNARFVPLLEKARKVLFGLFSVMKGLADAVAWFLDKFGTTIANHPFLSLLAVSSLRGVTVDLVRTLAGGVGGAYRGAAVAGAVGPLGSGAIGAGLAAGTGALLTSVAAVIGAPIVVGALWALVQDFRSRISAEKEQTKFAEAAGQNVSAGAFSPLEITSALKEYRTLTVRRQELENRSPEDYARYGKPDITEINALISRQEKLLEQMGIKDTHRIFAENAEGMVGNIALIDSAIEKIQKQNAEWEKSGNLIKQNTNYIQEMIDSGQMNPNIFSRTVANEQAFPAFTKIRSDNVGFDATKGIASPEADALITQLTEKERPLDTLITYSRTLQTAMEGILKTGEHIDEAFGDVSGLQNDAANFSLIVEGTLSRLLAHPAPGKLFTDFITNESKTYEQYVEDLSATLTSLKTQTKSGQPVLAVQEKLREAARLFIATDDTIDKQIVAVLGNVLKFHEQISSFEGTSEKASTLSDKLIDQIRALNILPNEVLEEFRKNIGEGIAEKGTGKVDKAKAQELGGTILIELVKAIAAALVQFKDEAFKKIQEKSAFWQREIDEVSSFPVPLNEVGVYATRGALGLPRIPYRPSGIINAPGEEPPVVKDVIAKLEADRNTAGNVDSGTQMKWDEFLRKRAIKQLGAVIDGLLNFEGDASTQLAISRFQKDKSRAGIPSNINPNFSLLGRSTEFLGEGGQDIQLAKLVEAERIYTLLANDFKTMSDNLALSNPERQKFIEQMDEMREKAAKVHDEFKKLNSGGLGVSFFHGLQESLSVSMNSLSNLRDLGKQIGDSLKLNLGNAFYDFISGAANAGSAFKKFGISVLQTAAQVASQKAASALLGILFSVGIGLIGGVASSSFANVSGAAPYAANAGQYAVPRATPVGGGAQGGPVIGGSGVRDDVPMMLMGGEHIVNKTGVRVLGRDVIEAANRGRIPRFGTGGEVYDPADVSGRFSHKDYFDPGSSFDSTPPSAHYSDSSRPRGLGNTNYTSAPNGGTYVYDGSWNYIGTLDSSGRWAGQHYTSDIYSGTPDYGPNSPPRTPGLPSDSDSIYQAGFNQFQDDSEDLFRSTAFGRDDIRSSPGAVLGNWGTDEGPPRGTRGTNYPFPGPYGDWRDNATSGNIRVQNPNVVNTWSDYSGWRENAISSQRILNTNDVPIWNSDNAGWEKNATKISPWSEGQPGTFGHGIFGFSGLSGNAFTGSTGRISFNRVLANGTVMSTGGGGLAFGNAPPNLMGQGGLFATGGFIEGGSKIKDDVLVLGMDGEFVVNQAAARYYGPKMMQDINSRRLKRMARGGWMVNPSEHSTNSGGINISMPINIGGGGGGGMSADERRKRQEQADNLKPLLKNAVLDVLIDQQRPGGILHAG